MAEQGVRRNRSSIRPEPSAPRRRHRPQREGAGGVIALALAVLVVLMGLVQVLTNVSVYRGVHQHAQQLQSQETSLKKRKSDLDHEIRRWSDRNYVVAQARERLGFVFPDEESARVTGAEKYRPKPTAHQIVQKRKTQWYKAIGSSVEAADQAGRGHAKGKEGKEGRASEKRTASKDLADRFIQPSRKERK